MVGIVKEIDGQKKIVPLTSDTRTGAPIGTLITQYKKVPMSGYLYCDGSTFDENNYPALYMYLGTNVLPDYRECVMVGAEQNTTDTIATHDVYGEGEFKDDQLQSYKHLVFTYSNVSGGATGVITSYNDGKDGSNIRSQYWKDDKSSANIGETTHGKQKAVYVYIKATSGLAENQQENVLNDVKGYVDNSNSYSTDEVKTGGKWIDGKPIYRKAGYIDTLPNSSYVLDATLTSSYVDKVISMGGAGKEGTNYISGSGYTDYSARLGFTIMSDGFRSLTYSGITYNNVTWWVEYTKTTD